MYEVLFSMFVTVTSNFIIIPDTGYNLWTWTETIMASIIFFVCTDRFVIGFCFVRKPRCRGVAMCKSMLSIICNLFCNSFGNPIQIGQNR